MSRVTSFQNNNLLNNFLEITKTTKQYEQIEESRHHVRSSLCQVQKASEASDEFSKPPKACAESWVDIVNIHSERKMRYFVDIIGVHVILHRPSSWFYANIFIMQKIVRWSC